MMLGTPILEVIGVSAMISTAGVDSEHVAEPPTPDSADAHEQPRSVGRRGSRIEHTVELASARCAAAGVSLSTVSGHWSDC